MRAHLSQLEGVNVVCRLYSTAIPVDQWKREIPGGKDGGYDDESPSIRSTLEGNCFFSAQISRYVLFPSSSFSLPSPAHVYTNPGETPGDPILFRDRVGKRVWQTVSGKTLNARVSSYSRDTFSKSKRDEREKERERTCVCVCVNIWNRGYRNRANI